MSSSFLEKEPTEPKGANPWGEDPMVFARAPADDDDVHRHFRASGAERGINFTKGRRGMMSDNNQGNGTGILVAAVVGAAVGAGVALLFAPCSGKETRDWLAHRTGELKKRTANAFEQGKDSIRRAVNEIGRDAESGSATLRS
jgi:YtxH-like protein